MRPFGRVRTNLRWGFGIAYCYFATVTLSQSVVQPALSEPGMVEPAETLAQPVASKPSSAIPVVKAVDPQTPNKPDPTSAIIRAIDDPAVVEDGSPPVSNPKPEKSRTDNVSKPADQLQPKREPITSAPPFLKPRIVRTRDFKSLPPSFVDPSATGIPPKQTYAPIKNLAPTPNATLVPAEEPIVEPTTMPLSETTIESIIDNSSDPLMQSKPEPKAESGSPLQAEPTFVQPAQPPTESPPKPIDAPTSDASIATPSIQSASPDGSDAGPTLDSTLPLNESANSIPQEALTDLPQTAPDYVEPPTGTQYLSTARDAESAIPAQSVPNLETVVGSLPTGTPLPYWITDGRLAIKAPLDRSATVDIDSLIWAALAHSPYIQSIQLRPQILETEINQAQGVFDPTRFASSIWNDRSDPVGNTLTTGGAPRLNEHFLDNKAGVRKKNELGGNWEAAQEIGLKDNNSNFFVPRQQADTRMVLRYTQPLMKGAGRTYNRASISIAKLSFDASNHETNRALQTHVMDVIESYWELVYQRSLVLQLHRGMTRLQGLEKQLTNRADLDAIRNQLLRAGSAINGLKARYARAMSQVVQSEERLRQLVNAPWIQPSSVDEIIPSSLPESALAVIQLEQELDAALMSRPDVLAIRDEIKAANVRLRVAEQDLRPTLNIVTDFYVRGLNGNYDVANSYADQFATGAPSYSGGLEYLRPKNQTVASAIRRARDLEMRQLLFQLEDKLLQTGTEVRSSIATVQATHAELASSVDATLSAQAEVEYLDARWQSGAFLEPTQISLNLEQLMDAEQRLIQAEGNWAATQSQYMIAIAKLRYVVGNLMSVEQVVPEP